MARRCSHCNNDGHNSRTCPNRVVRLFGVRLTGGSSMQKSASTGNLAVFGRSAAAAESAALDPHTTASGESGYASEAFHGTSSSRERKKGVPWTEHEHKMFLLGLKELGKGDWRGIARNYVMSRTPTQVASHAQKYFIRHSTTNGRKRRDSLFDIVPDDSTTEYHPSGSQEQEMKDSCWQPAQVSLEHADMKKDDSTTEGEATLSAPPSTMMYSYPPPICPVFFPVQVPQVSNEQPDIKINSTAEAERTVPVPPAAMQYSFLPSVYPGFYSAGFPCPMPYWPGYEAQTAVLQPCKIVRPTAVHSNNSINVGEHIGMSRPSLGVCYGEAGPPRLVPKLVGSSERHSAFHASASADGSSLDSSSSPIHAI